MDLVTYEWNFKKFTSQDRLNSLAMAGKIIKAQQGIDQYRTRYEFFTRDGKLQ